jgi:integrase/recombinase XerD
MKLSEAWELYVPDKQIVGYSSNTLKQYKIQVNVMIRHFGDVDLENIALPDLKKYLVKSKETLKTNNSLGHRVRFLRGFFRWAHEEGFLTTNPASKLKEPKEGKRVPKYIPEEALELIREATRGAREKALINLLYSTGCRIGEVYLMNRDHINWENRSIVVLGKGDKEREVYFDVKTCLWLKEYLNTRVDDCESLFICLRNPIRRATIHTLRRWVEDIAERANVDNIYPHKFRHSFCQHLVDRGAPLEAVSDLAGHARVSTTRIYASLRGEQRKAIYNKYF